MYNLDEISEFSPNEHSTPVKPESTNDIDSKIDEFRKLQEVITFNSNPTTHISNQSNHHSNHQFNHSKNSNHDQSQKIFIDSSDTD